VLSIVTGSSQQLSVVTKDAGGNVLTGRVITWASSNNAVATVSAAGLVTGTGAGNATITATSESKTGSSTVTVTSLPPAPVATVDVTPSTANIVAGSSQPLSVVTKDAGGNVLTGRVVTWASSNNAVATVSASGLVTGTGDGTATIKATS
jgi:uncharacterized protein YjdB